MAYIESTSMSRKDWPAVFQRQTTSPLDRSSIFKSYASAYVYASCGSLSFSALDSLEAFKKADNPTYWSTYTDSQVTELGACAYVGQIITVYSDSEIAAYIITSVGATPQLSKLAQTTITDEGGVDQALNQLSTDVANLKTSTSNLTTSVSNLEKDVETLKSKTDANTTYTIETATDDDGAIKVTPSEGSAYEVKVKGWDDLTQKVTNVTAVAAGKTKSYVYTNAFDTEFEAAAEKKDSFKIGDIIYFTDVNIPDRWVSAVLETVDETTGYYYTFSELEVRKIDLEPYATKEHVADSYVSKTTFNQTMSLKAEASDLTDLETTVGELAESFDTATKDYTQIIETVVTDLLGMDLKEDDAAVVPLQSQINTVSESIPTKISEFKQSLAVDKVGDSNGTYYISSIEQKEGKIIAEKSTMPNVEGIAEEKAAAAAGDAEENAKAYTDEVIGDIGDETVAEFVATKIQESADSLSTSIGNVFTEVQGVASRVKTIEDANYQTQINAINTAIDGEGGVKSRLGLVEGEITTIKANQTNYAGRISALETSVSKNAEDIGVITTDIVTNRLKVESSADITYSYNDTTETRHRINSLSINNKAAHISTDLLTSGTKMLILDCQNAKLGN